MIIYLFIFYKAPEVLLEQGHDQVVDWWSFGIVLHLLLTGEVNIIYFLFKLF